MERQASESAEIVRDVRIAATPETVFSFLIDPAKLVTWMGNVATLDPRPGGIFRLQYNDSVVALGEFVEVVPNRSVVFTWGWESGFDIVPPGASVVEITLTPDGDGGTLLHLVHRSLPRPAVDPHVEGWDHFLPRLVVVGSGGVPEDMGDVMAAGTD